MNISKINLADLIENRIFISPDKLPKEQVLGLLVKLICQADARLNFREVLQRVLDREVELSTTLDCGLSIPHARLDDFDKVLAALAVLPQSLQDVNGHIIRCVFLFVTPVRSDFFPIHLQVLSVAVGELSPQLMERLCVCNHANEVQQVLRQADNVKEMI